VPQRTDRMVPRLAPFGVYRSADGFVAICAPTETFARGLFTAMGMPELGRDARFATRDARVTNVDAMNDLVETFTSAHASADLVRLLERAGVPAAEVRTPAEAVRDWRVRARGETQPLEHPVHGAVADMVGMGLPIAFSGATTGFERPAPGLGEHNELVYQGMLGYSAERLASLRSAGVI